jgi:hypothetical protein
MVFHLGIPLVRGFLPEMRRALGAVGLRCGGVHFQVVLYIFLLNLKRLFNGDCELVADWWFEIIELGLWLSWR